jgi:Holliday junction DNA helicase RuvA
MLRGTVAMLTEEAVVIDAGGVGYLVHCAASTLHRLPRSGEPVELHTEMQVREDGITLFGFLEPAERVWFRMLQSVQGVGARVALSILGVLRPAELATAIALGDRGALTRAGGVGPRLAARLLAELKDRVGGLPSAPGAAAVPVPAAILGPAADAVSALGNLGYSRGDAYNAVARVQARAGAEAPVDLLIREALKELAV